MKYYNNGKNEKRFREDEPIPNGWIVGRIVSTITTKNMIWINNGVVEKFCDKDNIPDGFTVGRINKNFLSREKYDEIKSKHGHWYTNGDVEMILYDDDDIPCGFKRGRRNASVESREKMRSSHMGLHHTEETKIKISLHSNNNRQKAKETCLKKYGVEFYSNREKEYETKKKNNSFNSSSKEEMYYLSLCDKYGKENIIRNYKCDLYPYRCDFYIVTENKFIELNLHWTHGGMRFDENNICCVEKLNEWKEKAKTSKFYQNAIETWTTRDKNKIETALKNKLNYETIYKL